MANVTELLLRGPIKMNLGGGKKKVALYIGKCCQWHQAQFHSKENILLD
jgi:hypothetical protein